MLAERLSLNFFLVFLLISHINIIKRILAVEVVCMFVCMHVCVCVCVHIKMKAVINCSVFLSLCAFRLNGSDSMYLRLHTL